MTLLRQDTSTPVAVSNSNKPASKQIGWAVKLHVSYLVAAPGHEHTATDYQWIEGKTKSTTLANAITEKAKQLAMPGTISCWIDSGMFSITKPLR